MFDAYQQFLYKIHYVGDCEVQVIDMLVEIVLISFVRI